MRKGNEKMYRIKLATSDFYYVQEQNGYGWRKRGGFHASKRDAQQLVKDLKRTSDVPFPGDCGCNDKVVEYC